MALLALGACGALVAAALGPGHARAATAQDWSPFVLVAGLLLVGLVAEEDGLFAYAGHRLATSVRQPRRRFALVVVLVASVTAVLNLDTSVAFLTPVLVHTARRGREPEGRYLYCCLLLSNAGSILLPGSNLTNLIVLGQLHLSGARFVEVMAPCWVVAVAITGTVVALAERRTARQNSAADAATGAATPPPEASAPRPTLSLGVLAVLAVAVLVIVLRAPALPVAGTGVLAVGLRSLQHRALPDKLFEVLGAPVLVGLFGIAVALGALGRAISWPAQLLAHLDLWGTAGVAALATVVVNNLPAASLLAARVPPHPFALLLGLNLGPNLFVTGSLAWVLWWRAAGLVGAQPSLRRASALGALSVPFALAGAVGLLALRLS